MEAVVSYLDGDPDRPLVTGLVPNPTQAVPYTLPDFKTRSTFKSDTHKGNGYNELRFEDERDEEEVYLQAEKYLNGYVKKNETWLVEGSRHRRVNGAQSESIGGSKDMELFGDHHEEVKGSHHYTIEDSRAGEVGISDYLRIHGDRATEIERCDDLFVHEHQRIETLGRRHVEVGTTHYLNAGSHVVVQAGASITLNVGDNFVRIDGKGVQIEGSLVKVNCGGKPSEGVTQQRHDVLKPRRYSGPHAKRYARSYRR